MARKNNKKQDMTPNDLSMTTIQAEEACVHLTERANG